MLTFKEWLEEQYISEERINEASLNRIWDHVNKGDVMVAVTASRGDNSKERNDRDNAELRKFIQSKGWGFIPVKGRYIEQKGDEKRVVDDDTSIIFAPKEQADELKRFATGMGVRYKQDSIFYLKDKEAFLIATRRDSGLGKIGSEMSLGKSFHAQKDNDFMTLVKGQKYYFGDPEPEDEYKDYRDNEHICERWKKLVHVNGREKWEELDPSEFVHTTGDGSKEKAGVKGTNTNAQPIKKPGLITKKFFCDVNTHKVIPEFILKGSKFRKRIGLDQEEEEK